LMMVAVTFAPEELMASARALSVLLDGVTVNGVPATVSVNEAAAEMDCVEGD
jgi:hypothetical protein